MEVQREVGRPYRCRCVITSPDGGGRCNEPVTPDEPFCRNCEDRHPELEPFRELGRRVWAVPVEVQP